MALFASRKLRSGFSIVEIIVTASVIALLSTAIILQVRNVSPAQELENATDTLRSYLSQLRVKAVAGQNCCGGINPEGYVIGAPVNQPGGLLTQYAVVNGEDGLTYTAGEDIILQTAALPKSVQLVSCTDASHSFTTGNCNLGVRSFANPSDSDEGGDDNVAFNDQPAQGNVTFTLQHTGTNATSTVIINSMTMVVQ